MIYNSVIDPYFLILKFAETFWEGVIYFIQINSYMQS